VTAAANRVRVFVATTRGPVRVVRISQENPTVRSVVCLSGSLAALPFSTDYDAFVREPTGIVERQTGYPVYRTDLSAPVDGGDSWQLGLFLAHLLKCEDLLAEGDEAAGLDLLVTGGLDRDLNVKAVGHVAEKLERAGTAGAERRLFVLPASGDIPDNRGGWCIVPVGHPEQALTACLGPEASQRLYGSLRQAPARAGQGALPWRHVAALAGIAAAGLLAVVVSTSIIRQQDAAPEPERAGAGSMMQLEIVPRNERGCGDPVAIPPGAEVFTGAACAGIVTVRRDGEFLIRASVSGDFLSYVDADRYRRELHRAASGGDRLVLRIDFPYWVRRPVRLNVDVMQLALDGQPLQVAGRSIELRSGGAFDF